jgi:uncharacterized protein (TIGR03437 family)
MKHPKIVLFGKVAAVLSVVPALFYGYSEGPPAERTGAPGEQTCFASGCHSGTFLQNSGDINVDFGASATYTPGGPKQVWHVSASDSLAVILGFQLSVRKESDNGQAGTLGVPSGDTSVRVIQSAAGIQYIEHTRPKAPNALPFTFEWTPPATDVGNIKVYLACNAANGNFVPTGDRIHTRSFTLTPSVSQPKPTINQGGVVNVWSSKPLISDSAWISIYGSNFTSTTRTWRSDEIVNGKLPTQLDGVGVKINNKDAFVYFISPGQINVQVPSDTATGMVSVQVSNPSATSDAQTVNRQAVGPALFTWAGVVTSGGTYVGALFPDFKYVGKTGLLQPVGIETRPAKPGEFVLLFATGCGPTNPAVPAGEDVDFPTPTLTSPVTVRVNGAPAEVFNNTGFLIFAGECQFNVKIPDNAPDGDLPVELEIGGVHTDQDVRITVQK